MTSENAKPTVEGATKELDPRVAEGLAQAMTYYMNNRHLFFTSWEELRPRIIRRLEYQYGLTDAYVSRSRQRNHARRTGYPQVDYANHEIKLPEAPNDRNR